MTRWDSDWLKRFSSVLDDIASADPAHRPFMRRALADDPLAFALLYLGHHLKLKGQVTFSEIHFEWAALAEEWKTPTTVAAEWRHAFIAPRGTGKSTWWFLILPMWAAANGLITFVAAFADAASQAEGHLQSFKAELDHNVLLREDYPELCTPLKQRSGGTVADRQGMIHQLNGFVFAAKGVDSANLGMKVKNRRPDLIICDDVEPDESNYSALQAEKRFSTIIDAILPLSIHARVCLVGTVTMAGSVMHRLSQAAQGLDPEPWIAEKNFKAHHWTPFAYADDGTERSVWPQMWTMEWLNQARHTNDFAKNYLGNPMAAEGVYWRREDFHPGALAAGTRTILAIDPAVTSKKNSDYTGLAIVTYSPSEQRCLIEHAVGVRLTGAPLARHVAALVQRYPHVRVILIETNAGGELWQGVFDDIPGVKVKTHFSSKSKEVRFADAMRHWQARRVLHHGSLPMLEEQAIAFPKVRNDDVIDAAVAGVHFFLKPEWERKVKASVSSKSYI